MDNNSLRKLVDNDERFNSLDVNTIMVGIQVLNYLQKMNISIGGVKVIGSDYTSGGYDLIFELFNGTEEVIFKIKNNNIIHVKINNKSNKSITWCYMSFNNFNTNVEIKNRLEIFRDGKRNVE